MLVIVHEPGDLPAHAVTHDELRRVAHDGRCPLPTSWSLRNENDIVPIPSWRAGLLSSPMRAPTRSRVVTPIVVSRHDDLTVRFAVDEHHSPLLRGLSPTLAV